MRQHNVLTPFLSLTFLIATGCASASVSLKHSAVNPQYEGGALTRLLVVGLAEEQYRTPFEDTFVEELEARGVDAVASHWSVGDLNSLADQQVVDGAIETTGVDGVLTVRAVGLREANTEAWDVAYSAAFWLVDDFRDRRDMRRAIAFGSAVDEEDAASYGVEAELWRASTSESLWVGKTDAYDPGELRDIVAKFADVVVEELKRAGMI